jgi:uncharacterized protein YdeI (YjbR/CyaY-like superfamily)
MEITKTLYVADRKAWRKWLKAHYKKEPEIWLIYYKKASGKPRIEYNDAVEEALCFGWIDSQDKTIDSERYAQRFSPRNPKTPYSQTNKERLRELLGQGKVIPEVAASLAYLEEERFEITADVLAALKADKLAWKHFQEFSDRYKRIRIGFIEGARNRPAEFTKRLNYFVKMTAKNKQFGYGGVEKYY